MLSAPPGSRRQRRSAPLAVKGKGEAKASSAPPSTAGGGEQPAGPQAAAAANAAAATDAAAELAQARRERDISNDLLRLAISELDMHGLLREILSLLKAWSGCEAVGIRLGDGDDYPYYETCGFAAEFVRAEMRLCAVDQSGQVLRDAAGNPCLECMCGNIIRGRFDPSLPFFTERGSFWTNSTSELLAGTTAAQRQARTRNRCNGEGYESVALVPLRAGGSPLGLLQFNDRRKGMFSPESIRRLEELAAAVAAGVAHSRACRSLDESEHRYRSLVDLSPTGVLVVRDNRVAFANLAAAEIFGYNDPSRMLGTVATDLLHAESHQVIARLKAGDHNNASRTVTVKALRKDGQSRFVQAMWASIVYEGKPAQMVTCRDVTALQAAQDALRESEARLSALYDSMAEGLARHKLVWADGVASDYIITHVNPAFERITGMSRQEVVGRPATQVYGAKAAPFLDVYARVAGGGGPERFETYFEPMRRHFSISVFSPAPGEFATVFSDVTEQKLSKQALRESEQKYRTLFESSPDAVFMTHVDGRVYSANPAACEMFGYSEADLCRLGRQGIIDAGEPCLATALAERERTGRVSGMELVGVHSSGRKFPIEVDSMLVPGEARRAFVIIRDITRRKMADQALRDSEHRYRTLVEHVGLGVALMDSNHTVLHANAAYVGLLGLPLGDVAGKQCFRLRGCDDVCHDCPGEVAMETRAPAETQREAPLPDGSLRHVRVQAFPITNARGNADGFIEVLEDITERKQAQDALRESEHDLESAQSLARIGFWRWHIASDTARWSKETYRIFGRSEAELENHRLSFLDMVHPDDRQRVAAALSAAVQSGLPYNLDYRLPMPDGSEKIVHAQAEVICDDAGKPVLLRGSVQDVTETRLLEAQYRQAQKMEAVGRLAAGVAHDFNNQLTVIRGYSEMLLARLPKSDPLWQPLAEILSAARRAQSTTSHLLSFSRKQILAAEAFDLAEFLREAQSPISRMIGEDIKLIVAAAPGLPAVWVDKSGLHQAIMNLVVNARDAMPSGGSLTLSAASYRLDGSGRNEFAGAAPGDYVLLEVADSGTGMDAATLERVFDPFFTTKEPGKGTGLGLPMVMGFMRQSHGAVAIRSHSGEGTTVSLLLPLAASAPPATRQPAAASGKAAAATILVVEDDAAVRNLMVAALQKAGYRVLAVSDPANALDMVRSYAGGIDLVISDIIMPGMRGDEMAQQLAAAGCDVATLLVSGYADDKPSGGRPLLRKPFEVTELLDRVEQLLKEGTRPKN